MAEKLDCTTNGSNTATSNVVSKTLTIDTESDPGSWEEALKYSQHIRVIK